MLKRREQVAMLLATLGSLTEPDRSIDALVGALFHDAVTSPSGKVRSSFVADDNGHISVFVENADGTMRQRSYAFESERYTESIDAALSLFVTPPDGGTKASLLHNCLWERCQGDIPDNKLVITVLVAVIKLREGIR